MQQLRAKIAARLVDGLIHITVDWVPVDEGQVGAPTVTEEFRVAPERAACAYVSRVACARAQPLPGTFWIDEAGRRHFILNADAGNMHMLGGAAAG